LTDRRGWEEVSGREKEEEDAVLGGEQDQCVIHFFEDSIMKPYKYCLENEEEGGQLRRNNRGCELFKLLYLHLQKYHKESPLNF
jgi:hypothetical protein